MSQMTEEEFLNYTFQREDPRPDAEKREKSSFRRFWFLSVPAGAFFGFVGIAATGAPAAVWVVWVLATIVIQGMVEPK